MGLAISVGVYADLLKNDSEGAEWFKKTFRNLTDILKEKGIEGYEEPKTIGTLKSRAACNSFPYSFIHFLRRFYAKVIVQPEWKPQPVKEEEDPSKDPVIEEESLMFESHLLCHSDCEGFYLPIQFNGIIIDNKDRIPGGLLCSSYHLFDELAFIAPKLGVELVDTYLSDEEAKRINSLAKSDKGFYREYCVWIALYEAARLSIENKTAICFL